MLTVKIKFRANFLSINYVIQNKHIQEIFHFYKDKDLKNDRSLYIWNRLKIKLIKKWDNFDLKFIPISHLAPVVPGGHEGWFTRVVWIAVVVRTVGAQRLDPGKHGWWMARVVWAAVVVRTVGAHTLDPGWAHPARVLQK
jgi:hypothetical protein